MSPHTRATVVSQPRIGDAVGSAQLVARARTGDRDAFATLVEDRLAGLFRTACAILGNEADARDATQEAFVAAWLKLPSLRDVRSFDGWLHRLLVNQCRDALRRRRRVRQISLEDVREPASNLSAEHDSLSTLNAAFERLPTDAREILVLHHLHEMPLAEVAKRLGIPVGTAKWRLFRARRALERYLEAAR